MRLDEIEWEYQGNSVRVGMTWHGQGASVLMLPALSSISTRMEMWSLQERLGSCFTTLALDWVGFGDRPRPPLRWSPEIYRSFLAYLLTEVVPRPFCDNRRRTCRSVLSGRCRSAARLDGAFMPDCSNMARTTADDDGQKTPNVRSDQPHG